MPTHTVVAASPKILFHSTARRTDACCFKQYFSNLELLMLQGQQVDARNHDVSTQQFWWNFTLAQYPSHYIQMFLLDQGDLPLASGGFLKVITFQPCVWISVGLANGLNLSPAFRANSNPFNLTFLRNAVEVLSFQCFVLAHLQASSFQKLFTFKVAINTQ